MGAEDFSMDDVLRFLDEQKAEDNSRSNTSKRAGKINQLRTSLLSLADEEFDSTIKSIEAILRQPSSGQESPEGENKDKSPNNTKKVLQKETQDLIDSVNSAKESSSGFKVQAV